MAFPYMLGWIPGAATIFGMGTALINRRRELAVMLATPDTRQVARDWINRHVAADSLIYLPNSWGNPFLVSNEAFYRRWSGLVPDGQVGTTLKAVLDLPAFHDMKKYFVLQPGGDGVLHLKDNSRDTLANRHVEYVVTQNHPLLFSTPDPALMEVLKQDYQPVFEITPFREGVDPRKDTTFDSQDAFYLPLKGQDKLTRPGPGIVIHRRKP